MAAMLRGGASAPMRTNVRREIRDVAGRTRGGKLTPIGAFPLYPGENAIINQSVSVETDAVAGRLITPIRARYTLVFSSVQACDLLENADDDYAGVTEVIRQRMMNGEVLFDLEAEGEISKRCAVNPASYSGVLKVNKIVRLAYNAAVNCLRARAYAYATKLDKTNTAVAPALLSATVLQRLGGVLDPDDRINGEVQLELPSVDLPVKGITQTSNFTGSGIPGMVADANKLQVHMDTNKAVLFKRKSGNPAGTDLDIYAELDDVVAGGVSLTDFYNAEKMDRITRKMRAIIEANPEIGEEAVLRWAMGLQMEAGQVPVVVAQKEVTLNAGVKEALDGAGMMDETAITMIGGQINVRQVVPATELGGILMCLLEVKPDETLKEQPHPILSEPWSGINQVAEELKLDPVAVPMRALSADVTSGDESKTAFYTGHNALKRSYISYGYNRNMDPEVIETRNTLWQYAIPTSVTPENINYPATLDHYPFLDQNAEVAAYRIRTEMVVNTPMYFGPSPVEKVSIIDDEDLFGDGPVAPEEEE